MIHWLWDRTLLQASGFFVLVNILVMAGSVILCWFLGRFFVKKRIFFEWEPLRPIEITAAISSIFFNALISIGGWMLWKRQFILLPEKDAVCAIADVGIMLITMDFGMYCLHWLAHRGWIYQIFHTFHHRHEKTNPISLFVLHPLEVLFFGFLMIIFLMIYPMSGYALITYLGLNILWGTVGHSGVEPFPAFFQRIPLLRLFGTSTFHAGHHESPKYNFGFYTLIWDRIFGTIDPGYVRRFEMISTQQKQ